MSTIYNKLQNDFTIINNHIIQDNRVSGNAFKLYCYIVFRLGRNPEWEFISYEILTHFKEGKKALKTARDELINLGYLKCLGQKHRANGDFGGNDYEIYSMPACYHEGSTLQRQTLQGSTHKGLTNKNEYNKTELKKDITKKEDTAPTFSPSLENPTVEENLIIQGNSSNLPNSSISKKNLHVQKQKEMELKTKQEVEKFVRIYKQQEILVDGVIQNKPIFSENEITLITEYILRRKEAHKSKVKNTHKAITGVLNNILEVRYKIPLEDIFKQQDGIYVNCGTAGDQSKPFQTIKLNYFTTLIQKSTFTDNNAKNNNLRGYLNQHKEAIRNFDPEECFK